MDSSKSKKLSTSDSETKVADKNYRISPTLSIKSTANQETHVNPDKLMGKWYELIRYQNWYEPTFGFNTTARYTRIDETHFAVHNCTHINGKEINSYGTGTFLGGNNFRVDFPIEEILGLQQSYKKVLGDNFKVQPSVGLIDKTSQPQKATYISNRCMESPYKESAPSKNIDNSKMIPNYVVMRIWECHVKGYKYIVVSDPDKKSMFVLSQWYDPSFTDYSEIMTYLSENFDLTKIIQVPHYTHNHYCDKTRVKSYH